MRHVLAPLFFLGAVFVSLPNSQAQEDVKARVEAMEKELQQLKEAMKRQEDRAAEGQKFVTELKEKGEAQEKKIVEVSKKAEEARERAIHMPPEEYYWAKKSKFLEEKKLSPQFGGIYSKPFLRRFGRNTYLGGYMDASYRHQQTKGTHNAFEQLRFVPFIYSDISDRVKLASEIEIERGGVLDDIESNKTLNSGEVVLEFATVDFLLRDEINFRAGIVLLPLGKFNLVHDAPLQDLVDRPLVDQFIIPGVMRESGMGFFGTLYPTETAKLDYELYLVNGLNGFILNKSNPANSTVRINSSTGLRSAAGHKRNINTDINENPSVVGRVGFSPFLGLEIGASGYFGKYSDKRGNNLAIGALDLTYQRGPFELVGEGALAIIERDRAVKATGKVPHQLSGYYIEPRYHFMPGFLHDLLPSIFTDRSTFTLVTRWEQIDLGGQNFTKTNRKDRVTLGLNFRYTEDTVFKLDYQWNISRSQKDKDDNALIFGVATYF